MGQKGHPRGFRLGIVKPWKSRWYAERGMFAALLKEDESIRKYLHQRLAHAALSEVEIDRKPQKIVVTLHTARPGVVIGKQGAEVDKLRDELAHLTKHEVSINVEEVKRPEIEAQLVGDNVAHQLQQRISFRRAIKRAVQGAMRATGGQNDRGPGVEPAFHRVDLDRRIMDVRNAADPTGHGFTDVVILRLAHTLLI